MAVYRDFQGRSRNSVLRRRYGAMRPSPGRPPMTGEMRERILRSLRVEVRVLGGIDKRVESFQRPSHECTGQRLVPWSGESGVGEVFPDACIATPGSRLITEM